jgi:hypothetical protein
VVRAKARLLAALVVQLEAALQAVKQYEEQIKGFFASMPAADLVKTLPGGKSGTTVPIIWAELGDAKNRWESFRQLQAERLCRNWWNVQNKPVQSIAERTIGLRVIV